MERMTHLIREAFRKGSRYAVTVSPTWVTLSFFISGIVARGNFFSAVKQAVRMQAPTLFSFTFGATLYFLSLLPGLSPLGMKQLSYTTRMLRAVFLDFFPLSFSIYALCLSDTMPLLSWRRDMVKELNKSFQTKKSSSPSEDDSGKNGAAEADHGAPSGGSVAETALRSWGHLLLDFFADEPAPLARIEQEQSLFVLPLFATLGIGGAVGVFLLMNLLNRPWATRRAPLSRPSIQRRVSSSTQSEATSRAPRTQSPRSIWGLFLRENTIFISLSVMLALLSPALQTVFLFLASFDVLVFFLLFTKLPAIGLILWAVGQQTPFARTTSIHGVRPVNMDVLPSFLASMWTGDGGGTSSTSGGGTPPETNPFCILGGADKQRPITLVPKGFVRPEGIQSKRPR